MTKKIGTQYNSEGESVIKVSTTEFQQNLKYITQMLENGQFIELTKHNRKIAMVVPF